MTDTPPSPEPYIAVSYVPGRLGQEPLTGDLTAPEPAPTSPATPTQPWTTGTIPVQPRPSRTPLIAVLAAVSVAVLLAAGIGVFTLVSGKTPVEAAKAAAGPTSYRITGSMTLTSGYTGYSPCAGKGGYADIRAGAQVVITDSAGATIAIGSLDAGSVDGRGCVLPFSVPNVPAGKGFYGIEVSHRGGLKYEEAEFSTRNLDLTLG